MKAIGMYRKVDDLGRIVLPAELRRLFGIHEGDKLEIFVEDGRILLAKIEDRCVLCGSEDQLTPVRDRRVCAECRDAVRAAGPAPADQAGGRASSI